MSASFSEKLQAIYEELVASFADSPIIRVVPIDGNPPEKYKIVYHVPSIYKDEQGTIAQSSTQEIQISISFGFPHFPPSCKPLTPIYHPDFDPAAICIGDSWKESPSVVKLISHIGRMLTGEVYSTTNAFNVDAVQWYTNNHQQLPFHSFAVESTPEAVLQPSSPPPPAIHSPSEEIDMLDDGNLDSQLNYLEIEPPDNHTNTSITAEPEVEISRLQSLFKEKRFHQLLPLLQALPDGTLDARVSLIDSAKQAISQATEAYHKGKDFEQEGQRAKAFLQYKKVLTLVNDYPDIHAHIQRLKVPVQQTTGSVPNDQTKTAVSQTPALKPIESKEELTFYNEKHSGGIGIIPLGVGVCGLGLLAFGVFVYLALGSRLNDSEALLDQCKNSLQAGEFAQAQTQCETVLENIDKIQVIHQKQKKALKARTSSVLTSRQLVEGLAGNILVNGQYISRTDKQAQSHFNQLLSSAQRNMDQSDWENAIKDSRKGLKLAKTLHRVDEKQLHKARKMLYIARAQLLFQAAQDAFSQYDWDTAIDYCQKSLDSLKKLPLVLTEEQPRLDALIKAANTHKFYESGEKLMEESKLSRALEQLEKARSLGDNNVHIPVDIMDQLRNDISKIHLYQKIQHGKEAFAASQWDLALERYNQAIHLLEIQQQNSTEIDSEQYHERLSRITLRISVVRDRQKAATRLKKKEFEQAVTILQSMIKSIQESDFAQDQEFQTIIKTSHQAVKDAELQILLSTSEEYIRARYKTLFIKHYPASTIKSLSKLKVTFVKKIKGELLFKLQCVESQGGSPLRLLLDYLYNPVTHKLTFYTDQ